LVDNIAEEALYLVRRDNLEAVASALENGLGWNG
jgi:hypothetical protein